MSSLTQDEVDKMLEEFEKMISNGIESEEEGSPMPIALDNEFEHSYKPEQKPEVKSTHNDLYCSCSNPVLKEDEANRKKFYFCKTCRKEHIKKECPVVNRDSDGWDYF